MDQEKKSKKRYVCLRFSLIHCSALFGFEYLIVPVNLPSEDHWLLVVISVIAMCIHIYDSYEQTQERTLRTIFDTIKDGFLSKERQFVKDKKKRD